MIIDKFKKLLKPILIFGLLTSFFTIVISIAIGEYIVRHTLPQNTYNFARSRGMNIFDKGENIPITLQKNVNNFHHVAYTVEFDHYVSTNSQGLRGKEISPEKPQDTYRILLLGDSMTFGWGVNEEETFAKILESNLNNFAKNAEQKTTYEVINAGFTDGKTLDSYWVFLKETGLKLKPDMVILNFFPYNDLLDLTEMKWDKVDEKGLPQKISSKTQTIEDGYIINIYKKNWMYEIPVARNSHLGILLMTAMEKGSPNLVAKIKRLLKLPQDGPKDFEEGEITRCLENLTEKLCPTEILEGFKTSEKLISEMKNLANENNSDFLVTILVDPNQAKSVGSQKDPQLKATQTLPQKSIREFLDTENINHLDFLKYFANGNAKSYFFDRDGHFNVSGHQRAGNYLSVFLTNSYFKNLKIDEEFLEKNLIKL